MTSLRTSEAACVICGKPAQEAYRPFCSKRCANVDLQRWLTGAYVIPGEAPDDGEEGPSAPAEDD
jgi:endogenous inhibitor of DNA gyrase (YacG/DUF329 family)